MSLFRYRKLIASLLFGLVSLFNVSLAQADELTIVTSIHPYFDLTQQLVGDNATVIRLLPPGASPHTFDPSPRDVQQIAEADVVIINGGVDTWVLDLVEASGNEPVVMEMFELLSFQGIEGGHDHDHGDHDDHSDEVHDHDGHDHGDHDDEDHKHDHDDHDHSDHDDHSDEAHDHDDHDHSEHMHSDELVDAGHACFHLEGPLENVMATSSAMGSVASGTHTRFDIDLSIGNIFLYEAEEAGDYAFFAVGDGSLMLEHDGEQHEAELISEVSGCDEIAMAYVFDLEAGVNTLVVDASGTSASFIVEEYSADHGHSHDHSDHDGEHDHSDHDHDDHDHDHSDHDGEHDHSDHDHDDHDHDHSDHDGEHDHDDHSDHDHDDEHDHSEHEDHDHDHDDEHHDEEHHDEEHDHDHDEEHDHDDHAGHDHDDHGHSHSHGGINPHIWLDPVLMVDAVELIAAQLAEVQPANADVFMASADSLGQDLMTLHSDVETILAPLAGAGIVPFHDAWPYFTARYGLEIIIEIEPSPGREPTPRYLANALELIQASGTSAIFSEVQLPSRPAEILAEQADVGLYILDPIGGGEQTQSYQDLLMYNAQTIFSALAD